MKLAYDFSPTTRLTYTAAMWSFSQNSRAQTYLTGANGLPLYNVPASGGPYGGPYWGVTTGGLSYYPWGLDPNHQTELQLSQGLELKSDSKGVFDYDAVVSANNMLSNGVQSANDYTVNSSGLNTRLTGTNWVASDLRFIWRPTQQLADKHEVSFGGHLDQYVLNENVDNMPIWPSFGGTSPDFASYGKTQTKALYVQDVWAFQPDWKLTVGGREEFWDAFDGQLTALARKLGPLRHADASRRDELSGAEPAALLAQGVTGMAGDARLPGARLLWQRDEIPDRHRAVSARLQLGGREPPKSVAFAGTGRFI
jgi:iron complex outermembrane receptor protein